MKMKPLLEKHKAEVALVVGNGVNLYGSPMSSNSWQNLLITLAAKHLPSDLPAVPGGIALTEFYDLLELKSQISKSERTLQQEFCDLMDSWRPLKHHEWIVNWAVHNRRPILTTNFEHTLAEAGSCSLQRTTSSGFTDYYPWETYFGNETLDDPAEGFGIWHINGMQHYHRSIRLGLSHYMGSVERARGWLHKGNERRLFSGKNERFWAGAASWLHVVFNCPLLIFGLTLDENEVFFRWLLIERARYFKKFPSREKPAWYIYTGRPNKLGKTFFLKGVGVMPLQVEDYSDIYGVECWG